ncbi:TIGR04282 family arsenosugar biosynthesis glycosyltransferase [Bradyrhizobium sp.]|uniref:TIGR04282 family arsenosugar biosynthesis glycosyltransferase n=1 Tax=Bradyrhizobium sp. TaxID=376 RepID=UPI0023931BBA|nr:TIGR04282 family arsenosugar biosynthesis glycosyltransferase [Bradyrhizobium sp.]MDE1933532.1 TIGR04282 family arsenosugar biosynthesis glycosyltransferase [Bradyrhizobium sp.]
MRSETGDTVQLAIFAKAPVAGYAKTRLISALGAEGAANVQAFLVRRAVETAVASSQRPITLWCAPDASHDLFQSLQETCGVETFDQTEGGLGERMFDAFERLTVHGPTLLIGSDCPMLSAGDLDRCASMLRVGADAVFVPAEDGGYVLIGLKRPHRRLFEDIAFGTDAVMHQTRERLRELHLSAIETDALWDVDTVADYERARSEGLLAKLRL